MTINNIPPIEVPGVFIELNFSAGGTANPVLPNDVLYIGSRLATGTVAAGVIRQVIGPTDAETFWGTGSHIAGMVERGRGSCPAGQTIRQWGIALDDDAGGTPAAGNITFAGTATSGGTVRAYIGGRRIDVGVLNGTAATAIPALLVAKDHSKFPVALTDGGLGVLTITARNDGEIGNDIDIRVDETVLPSGITATPAAMAAGATNPDITATIAAIAAMNPKRIVLGYDDTTNVGLLEDELELRAGYDREQFARAFVGSNDTANNTITYAANFNSQYLTVALFANSPAPPWEIASAFAVVDASLSDPSANRNNLPIAGLAVPNLEDGLGFSAKNSALGAGVALIGFNEVGDVKIIRHVTTYRLDGAGNPDKTWQDASKVFTLWACAYTADVILTSKWGDAKIASDGTEPLPGQKILTPRRLVTELLTIFDGTWVPNGWVEAGARDQFRTTLLTQRNLTDLTRMDGALFPNLIEPLNVIALAIAPAG